MLFNLLLTAIFNIFSNLLSLFMGVIPSFTQIDDVSNFLSSNISQVMGFLAYIYTPPVLIFILTATVSLMSARFFKSIIMFVLRVIRG